MIVLSVCKQIADDNIQCKHSQKDTKTNKKKVQGDKTCAQSHTPVNDLHFGSTSLPYLATFYVFVLYFLFSFAVLTPHLSVPQPLVTV